MDSHSHAPNCHSAPTSHCHTDGAHARTWFDGLLWGSLVVIALACAGHWFFESALTAFPPLAHFAHSVAGFVSLMWPGMLIGMLMVGIMSRIPRGVYLSVLGKGGTLGGIFRAMFAGVLLDVCSHGILLVGMKLYERGASLGQVMAFLIASPWNSFSLLFIMVSLIGLSWTLTFLVASMVIAVISGCIFDALVKRGVLPANPHSADLPESGSLAEGLREALANLKPGKGVFLGIVRDGFLETRMVMRWVLFGIVLGGLFQTFVSTENLQHFFGPTLFGMLFTAIASAIIEVCSEGATPIAADLLNRAMAPGNAFLFLMAAVSTDYTEFMALKETTRSWKISIFLPLVTLPQIFLLAWLMNAQ